MTVPSCTLRFNSSKEALFNKQDYLSDGQGYLSIRQLVFAGPPSEVIAAVDRERELDARAAAARTAKASAAAAAEARKQEEAYEARAAARIARGGVRIGMTREQVRQSSWGEPDHINLTTTVQGQSEQWVYPENNFLHFSNGILVGIQSHADKIGFYGIAQ